MISLIIPCFNEEQNLKKLLEKLNLLINEFSDEKIEIVMVDNGSTDNSNNIIRSHKLFLENRISLLNIKKNIGYGDGLNQGINFSKGDVICWFHADLHFDPFDSIKIYKKFKNALSK